MQETWVQSLGREDPVEKEMATHSSTLTWKLPWMEEPGRLQSVGLQRVRHDWATKLNSSILHRCFTVYGLPGCSVMSDSFSTPWTLAHEAPLSIGFLRQEYWVAISSSKGSSQPRDRTCISCVSCFTGGFFAAEPWGKLMLWFLISLYEYLIIIFWRFQNKNLPAVI